MTESSAQSDALSPPTRIMLIDDGHGLSARLETALHRTALRIEARTLPGYLMALGDLGVSDDPPHVIIGPVDGLNGDLRATAAALHELSPHSRLIAVSHQPRERTDQVIAAGFDECLPDSATPADIARCLAVTSALDASSTPAVASSAVSAETAPAFAPFDTALLDQLIHPRGHVVAQAMTIIQSIPGLEECAFLSDPASAPATAPAADYRVVVAHLNQTHGLLHVPDSPAARTQLPLAADWLARWLHLQRQQQDLWFMAMRDELTQAWNRRYFQRFLRMALARAAQDRTAVTLLIFDIDDFKQYNDHHGHKAGDDILRETVKLMKAVVRENDVVARIGGDEFAVIFWDAEAPRRANSRHPADIARVVERFRKALAAHRFPKLTTEAAGSLTVSGGLASYPWDAQTADDLIERADQNAFDAKRQGKNVITFGSAP